MKSEKSEKVQNSPDNFKRALKGIDDSYYILRLYVFGMTCNSRNAVMNIKKICEEYLKGRYELEIIDICQQPILAKEAQIVAVPTLVKVLPLPLLRLVGDMSHKERVLLGLGLQQGASDKKSHEDLLSEIEELQQALEETKEVLRAVRNGEVDALVVSRPEGDQLFALQRVESPAEPPSK